MKQLSILAVVVALALAVFYFGRDKGPDATNPAANQRQLATGQRRPQIQRPNVSPRQTEGRRTLQSPMGHEVVLSEEALAQLRRMEENPWKDVVDEESLVRVEDAWSFDLSGIDFDADVLCTVGGVPILQSDFRRHAVLNLGQILLRSDFLAAAGRRVAKRSGMTYGLTDAQFELYLETWADRQGFTPQQGLEKLGLMSKQTVEGARYWRRNILEPLLAFYPSGEGLESVPMELRAVLGSKAAQADVVQVIGLLRGPREALDDPENMAMLVAIIEPMALMFQRVGGNEIAERTWTYLDQDLPTGIVAAYYNDELPLDSVAPPWTLPGEVTYIETDGLWQLVSPLLSRYRQEDLMRSLIWGKVLRAELESQGALPSAEEAWIDHAVAQLQSRVAALPQDFIVLSLYGYPGMDQFRMSERLQAGFRAAQPEGWDSDESLSDYFQSQRFFIEQWQPDLDIALFPPRDPKDLLTGPPDWEGSRARAQAILDEVEAGGDFDALLDEHNRILTESFRKHLGSNVAMDFAERFRSGHLKAPLAEIQSLLKEQRYNQMLQCMSVIENAVVRLERGEISPPWRTPIGYVLVRMNNARLTALESEFEDLIDATRARYYDQEFMRWANGVLAGATLVSN